MKYLLLLFFWCTALNAQQTIFIIVHGTWATNMPWSKTDGDFFKAVQESIIDQEAHVISFTWSGKLDNFSREQAGKDLANLIESYPSGVIIHLITHSHGSTVGILASQRLHYNHIDYFYALGTPVNTYSYMPNMEMITYFFNLFSFRDFVQPVMGIFEREYPAHERIANIRVMINGIEPGHSELHSPLIGTWLSSLDHTLYTHEQPLIVDFHDNQAPTLAHDPERKKLIEYDTLALQALVSGLGKELSAWRNNPLSPPAIGPKTTLDLLKTL